VGIEASACARKLRLRLRLRDAFADTVIGFSDGFLVYYRALQAVVTCRQSLCLRPIPSATKPAIITMTSFSLWRHSRGSGLRRSQPATKPLFSLWRHSHYDVIRYWAGRTYGHLTAFNI